MSQGYQDDNCEQEATGFWEVTIRSQVEVHTACLAYSVMQTLAVRSSEMSVNIYQNTRRHNPGGDVRRHSFSVL
jgi:hypothetical protein